jgi:hypothetical protein
VVVGSSIADNSRPQTASGEVRAFDARAGALGWIWAPILRIRRIRSFTDMPLEDFSSSLGRTRIAIARATRDEDVVM